MKTHQKILACVLAWGIAAGQLPAALGAEPNLQLWADRAQAQYEVLCLEAEDGVLSPDTSTGAPSLPGQEGRNRPSGTVITLHPGAEDAQPAAVYHFTVNKTGTYWFWFRGYTPTVDRDSFSYELDSTGQKKYAAQLNNLGWKSPASFPLSAGKHTLTIRTDEDNVVLDQLLLTDDPNFVPEGICQAPAFAETMSITNPRVKTAGTDTLLLAWEGEESAPLAAYRVYVNGALTRTVPPRTRECVISNLSPDTTYRFTVEGADQQGTVLHKTEEFTGRTLAADPPPQEVRNLAAQGGNNRITLTWTPATDPGTLKYLIRRDGLPIAMADPSAGSFEDAGRASGVKHTYSIAGINGRYEQSPERTVTTRVNPYINVKDAPYFAKGDGVTDDTAALQQAFHDWAGKTAVIHIPNGIYLISGSLEFSDYVKSAKRLVILGEDREKTILKLKDNTPGFQDPGAPKAFLDPYSGPQGLAGDGARDEINYQAFHNAIRDLTIDTGAGNPGAVAVRWTGHNQGGLERVTLRSGDPGRTGAAGLDLTKEWTGPGFMKDLSIEGFDVGILGGNSEYNMVFEDITLRGQRVCGIKNRDYPLTIRRLTSENTVPAVINEDAPLETEYNGTTVISNRDTTSMVTIIDGTLNGSGPAAIQNVRGAMFLRNVKAPGYEALLEDQGNRVKEAAEYSTLPTQSSFSDTPQPSLNLPFTDPPELPVTAVSACKSAHATFVTDFGAVPNDSQDDTAAIQKAIDSGKRYILFPNGSYNISDTIYVRNNTAALIGFETTLNLTGTETSHAFTGKNGEDTGVFQIGETTGGSVHFEGFSVSGSYTEGPVLLLHTVKTPLIVRHVSNHISGNKKCPAYRNTVPGGQVFAEDISYSGWFFNGQQVWAKQLDPEQSDTAAKIINNGGDLVILGYKAEGNSIEILSKNGAKTEILGGSIYPASSRPPINRPAFRTIDSQLSVNVIEAVSGQDPARSWTLWFQDTQNGITTTVSEEDLPKRVVLGTAVGLYTSYQKEALLDRLYLDGTEYPYFGFTDFKQNIPLPAGTVKPPQLKAEPFHPEASVEIQQAASLKDTAKITVAENGKQNLYEITFLPDSNANLEDLRINLDNKGGTLPVPATVFGFDPDKTEYTFFVPASHDGAYPAPVVSAQADNPAAHIAVQQAESIPSTAVVSVTAENGTARKTYQIRFEPAAQNNAKLSSIRVWNCYLEDFAPEKTNYQFALHQGLPDSVLPGVAAVAQNASAKVDIKNAESTNGTCTITVTSADGTAVNTYTIDFSAQDNNADLKEITLDGTPLSGFDPKVNAYLLPEHKEYNVAAAAQNGSAEVTVTSTPEGYAITVTPAHGLFHKVYTLQYAPAGQ